MNLVIITRNGFEQELREIQLVSIDGVPFEQIVQPSLTNHEHRLQVLEEVISGILQPIPQSEEQLQPLTGES